MTVLSAAVGTGADDGAPSPEAEEERPVEHDAGRQSTEQVRVHESSGGWKQRTIESQYDLGEEIARGGMGRILVARDRELGREVAVKVLAPQSEGLTKGVVERFLQEAQITAQLEHPNILPVYGVECATGAPAFTMRLLGRRTFKSYLEECRVAEEAEELGPDHVLEARLERFLGVCHAITYAHARGVVHRDLKPSNVLLGRHHAVYVVDWGAAKLLDPDAVGDYQDVTEAPLVESDADVETKAGELIGTPMYMAPEQAMGAIDEQGPAADQFALGMMLQEIVTLAPPRDGSKSDRIAKAVIGDRVSMEAPPGCEGLVAIVERATKPEPEDRFPSMIEFSAAVRLWLRQAQLTLRPPPASASVPKPDGARSEARAEPTSSVPPRPRKPTLALLVGLAILTGSLGAVAASLWSTGDAERRAGARSQQLSTWSGRVAQRGAMIDHHLAQVEAEVAALAARFEERMPGLEPRSPMPALDQPLEQAGLAAPSEPEMDLPSWLADHAYAGMGRLAGRPPLEGARHDDDYGMPVHHERTGVVWPAGVSDEQVVPLLHALGNVTHALKRPMRPDADGESLALHLTYAAFEEGVLLNYPAYEALPEDYDPRARPWYRDAIGVFEPRFGAPYPDASGTGMLVPCNQAILKADGAPAGVAGADFALRTVRAMITMDQHEGWTSSALLDGEARAFVDTARLAAALGPGLHDNAPAETHAIEADVRDAIAGERHAGWVERDAETVFYRRLVEIDWTLLVRVAR